MNEQFTEQVTELTQKISTLGVGYNNAVVLHAAIHTVAKYVATNASTEAELEQFADEVDEALFTAIAGYLNAKQP